MDSHLHVLRAVAQFQPQDAEKDLMLSICYDFNVNSIKATEIPPDFKYIRYQVAGLVQVSLSFISRLSYKNAEGKWRCGGIEEELRGKRRERIETFLSPSPPPFPSTFPRSAFYLIQLIKESETCTWPPWDPASRMYLIGMV